MLPAARVGDLHVCPMVTGTVPHIGGPILGPGETSVLLEFLPAAVVGDSCTCTGTPDTITAGSTTVLVGNKPAVRVGDMTSHGGSITAGASTVLMG